jgi:hypothetical protein
VTLVTDAEKVSAVQSVTELMYSLVTVRSENEVLAMATLLLLVLIAVVLIVVSLRALRVAIDALGLTYRLSLTARAEQKPASSAPVSGPIVLSRSAYPPIKILHAPNITAPLGIEKPRPSGSVI